MASRNRNKRAFFINFDSLVDIVSNINGILILFASITALIVLTKSFQVKSSLATGVQEIETEKNRISFECINDRIIHLDEDGMVDELNNYIRNYDFPYDYMDRYSVLVSRSRINDIYKYFKYDIYVNKAPNRLNVHNPYYYIGEILRITDRYNRSGTYFIEYSFILKDGVQGEDINEIKNIDSNFMKVVKKMKPNSDFAYFFVHPNSYKAFRAAREVLWAHNIDVGWKPLEAEENVAFGTGGQKSRPQEK